MTDVVEISWVWAISLITLGFGIAIGVAVGYLSFGNSRRREQELEQKLDTLQQESDGYRQQVSDHFLRSSELVQKMTDSYREVYEHLAHGSEQLCSDPVTTPQLDIPETSRLEKSSGGETATPPAGEPAANVFSDAETDNSQEPDLDEALGDAPKVPSLDEEEFPTDNSGKPSIH